jgi:O-antigen/teichoic acid export membrane protein
VLQNSRATSTQMLRYGWPLLISFGVTALGASMDRLLLAHYAGTPALGPYGVMSDVLRQSFTIFGEAVSLSLIAVAKVQANRGDAVGASEALRKAFNGCLAAAAFGIAFFVVFGDLVTRVILGPQYVDMIRELIPLFAIAFAFQILRNYYFAQVIYFTHASYLELVVSTLFVVVSVGLSVLLIPAYGPRGAAFSLMTGCIVSCLAFAAIGRTYYRLPIDLGGMLGIPALAVLFVAGAWQSGRFFTHPAALMFIEASIFIAASLFVVHRFGLLQVASIEGRDYAQSGCNQKAEALGEQRS